jgi:5-methylcytosine-specific restriction endonuclease McrA
LTAVVLLAPHLTPPAAEELLAAATHKTKAEVERLLAERFPRPDLPNMVQAIAPAGVADTPAPGPAVGAEPQLVPEPVGLSVPLQSQIQLAPPAQAPLPPARIAPLAPERFALQVTITGTAHDLLRQAQALLGHSVPSGDVAQVIERALMALVTQLEKQKFAKCDRPGTQRGTSNSRHVPAAVKRAVFQRDRGQCTFVCENGRRCESRTRLEYDHLEAVARGGRATVSGIRLLCRTHNQHAAERVFGRAFMDGKRERGRSRGRQHAAIPSAPG